jgi:integrase
MAIDTPLVIQVLEPIWHDKTETATRVRNRIELILDWATVHKHREGENPARWRGHLDKVFPKRGKLQRVVHRPALRHTEIGSFMAELREREGVPARALEFLILTAGRTDEVREAPWSEFDLDERIWTIPDERMKGGKAHRVPLSDAAIEILTAMRKVSIGSHVFAGRDGPIGPAEMRRVLASLRAGVTVHGFRSTFRDWSVETTPAYPREVAEMALAHTVKGETEEAYWRSDLFDKRRVMMQDWSQRCAGGAVVVPFKALATS